MEPTPRDHWTRVDAYLADTFVPQDSALAVALAASRAAGLPEIQVAPNQGRLLELLARSLRARAILELGTLGGYSTLCLARGLAPGGRVLTLEAEPRHAAVAQACFAQAGLGDTITLRLGRALDSLAQLVHENAGPFDLVFIDADKPSLPDYFEWSLKLSRPGTVIVVDNVIRDGEVANGASADPSVQGVRRMNALIAAEPRVSATALQTVGSKGYDGFAFILVER
jgi:predicted O-methyltransferase YrrM